jgi:hypothetical protein
MPVIESFPEMFIVVPAYSVIARYSPRKWMVSFYALVMLLGYFANKAVISIGEMSGSAHANLVIGLISFCMLAALALFILSRRKSSPEIS